MLEAYGVMFSTKTETWSVDNQRIPDNCVGSVQQPIFFDLGSEPVRQWGEYHTFGCYRTKPMAEAMVLYMRLHAPDYPELKEFTKDLNGLGDHEARAVAMDMFRVATREWFAKAFEIARTAQV